MGADANIYRTIQKDSYWYGFLLLPIVSPSTINAYSKRDKYIYVDKGR